MVRQNLEKNLNGTVKVVQMVGDNFGHLCKDLIAACYLQIIFLSAIIYIQINFPDILLFESLPKILYHAQKGNTSTLYTPAGKNCEQDGDSVMTHTKTPRHRRQYFLILNTEYPVW